ncbi:cytochrome P450 family protein [Ceratobasidium sp. AG-Ba]|nr:cytochrome P450 family protein [Ceratobasidium sp. AG-Ba]
MLSEPTLTNWGGFIGFLPYNDHWYHSRRLMRPWLSKKTTEDFHSCQSTQTRALLRQLLAASKYLRKSEELEAELYGATATTLARYIYGYEKKHPGDPLLGDLKEATNNFLTASLPSNFFVNIFPSLMHVPSWFPGAGWKRTAQEWRKQQEAAVTAAFEWTKAQMSEGTCEPSVVSSLLNESKELGPGIKESEDHIKQLAVSLFIAGPDTIVSTMMIFITAMLLFPEVQRRAQQEVDSVLNIDQLPTLADQIRLEYVGRVVEEVLRWRPIAPLGGPHATSQDDTYRDLDIPKGATVAITRDEDIYEDPDSFNPDRFLDPTVPTPPVFGFGRRACPGQHYAKASLFLQISSILATFDIVCEKNDNGFDINPTLESADQVPYHTKPFQVKLVPRSVPRIALLEVEE